MKEATLEHKGCRLHYAIAGQGEPVVLIQGAGVAGTGWLPQVETLSSEYTFLIFDNRGMGRSLPVGCPLTIEQMAEDTLALMDAAGWSSAHVVGHSLGGMVAQQIALTQHTRVRSLTLMCTFSHGADASKLSLFVVWTGMRTRIGTLRQRRRAFLQMCMPADYLRSIDPNALAERLAPIYGYDLGKQPPIALQQLAAARKYDSTPRLRELAGIPTLVITAAEDRIARPEYGRVIAEAIPGARYVEVPEAAHGLPLQKPEVVNRLLREHFQITGRSHICHKKADVGHPPLEL
jgi:pimeloyl-ACP methyl ester carboxylesterase